MKRYSGRVLAGLVLAVCLASSVRADVAEGVAAYESGDYKRAIEEWQPLAAKDNVDALFNLGQMYRLGKGVPQDYEMAEHYYTRAAELGHPVAQGNLATLYYFMKKPKPDKAKAAYWWTKAARAGDARSQLNLGILYYNGDYVQKDLVVAYAWISLAFRGGITEAADALQKLKPSLSPDQVKKAEALIPTLVEKPAQDVRIVAPAPPPAKAVPAKTQTAKAEKAAEKTKEAPVKAQTAQAEAPKPAPVKPEPEKTPAAKIETKPAPGAAVAALPAEKNAAKSAASRAGGYALQLGSVGSEDAARQEWRKLQKQYGDLIGAYKLDIDKADLGAKGVRYRVRAAGLASRDEAIRLCEALRSRKGACLPVHADGP